MTQHVADRGTAAGIDLVEPHPGYHASWLAAAAEFAAAGDYQHGSGLAPDGEEPRPGARAWRPAELPDPAAFSAFVAELCSLTDPAFAARLGRVPDTKLWIVAAGPEPGRGEFLGSVSLRHELNDFLLERGGHIGYSVRPAARRRGIATAALRLTLQRARSLGLDRVLVTCEAGNVASARTIEGCDGALEDVREGMRRYWIELPAPGSAG